MHNSKAITIIFIYILNILNNFKNICLYYNTLLYKKERKYNNCWQCYDNNKIDILAPDLQLFKAINILKSKNIKEKK